MEVNKYIFREYDIRGKVEEDFPSEVVVNLGKAFGTFIKRSGGQEIALSGDVRLSTPELINQFKEGVLSTGVDVINIGIVPTPVNYYSMFKLDVAGAVQITGSHNPPEFNGFKMSRNKKSVFGESIQNLRDIIENEDFENGTGDEAPYKILPDYKKMISSKIELNKKLKVVLDCGNAAGAVCAPEIFRTLNIELEELYCDVDGTFPNHHPDPTVEENLKDLIEKMKTGRYDVGIAFDGDADRAVFIDDKGNVISGSMMTTLISDYLSKENNNLKVVHNVNVSPHALSVLNDRNIQLYRCKVGHSNIKKMMREIDADFGGEHSAHFYYKENFYADSAILTLLIFMKIISTKEEKVSRVFENYKFPPSSGEINFVVKDVEESLRNVEEVFDVDFDYLDGLTCFTENYWFNIRGSNTEPKLRVNVEGRSEKVITEVLEKISSNI